ncbi:MAG: hypothetical protein A3J24_00055 [Deltaproteobacteria bacterium RIFCSPLOWO2_02_FULL_53_8]|nr:MAG: hypothetical protein A3J24_00055 [Deltaproteobacteria bacterium RIFCSPLOWO2_02_FULL_53_8]
MRYTDNLSNKEEFRVQFLGVVLNFFYVFLIIYEILSCVNISVLLSFACANVMILALREKVSKEKKMKDRFKLHIMTKDT